MRSARPALVVFQGAGFAPSEPEGLVNRAKRAATLDLLAQAALSQSYERVILVTEDQELSEQAILRAQASSLPVDVIARSTEPFHFGEDLRAVCHDYGLERVVYIGGGAMPLGAARDLADLARAIGGPGECVVANNLFSCDLAAFWPASILNRISLPANDNDLAWLLHFPGGLPYAPTPRTLATQFDIDTPIDVAALWWATQAPPLSKALGPQLTGALAGVPEAMPTLAKQIEATHKVMSTRRAQVMLAGRVSSWTWRRLETNLPCQTRILSEERGMQASGKEERGEVRSLLGLYTDLAGISGLISALEQTADAAFLDTRVLFAHRRLRPSPADRFASDALMPTLISDPWVRELTEAALSARMPILLGGHSLVAGGVWAWSERIRASGSAAR